MPLCPDVTTEGAVQRCVQQPRRQADLGPDSSAYFATGRQSQANASAQTELRNRQNVISGRPGTAFPGEQAQIQRDRIRLEQDSSRIARDRLRTAPYSQTVGSVQQPF